MSDEITWLSRPLQPSGAISGIYAIAEDFDPSGIGAAIHFRNVEIAEYSDVVLLGRASYDEAPDCFGILIDDAKVSFSRLEIRGFKNSGVYAKGWRESLAHNVTIADCRIGMQLDYIEGRNGNHSRQLDFEHIRMGDMWGPWNSSKNPNAFRPWIDRGDNGFVANGVQDIRIRDFRARGEHYASLKLSVCWDAEVTDYVGGHLAIQGYHQWDDQTKTGSNNERYALQEPSHDINLRNIRIRKSASGSLYGGAAQGFICSHGCYDIDLIDVQVAMDLSPEEQERAVDFVAFHVATGSSVTVEDLILMGPGKVGLAVDPARDGSNVTIAGGLLIARGEFEQPVRIR